MKLIKIMWKLSLAFVAAGDGEPKRARFLDPFLLLPQGIQRAVLMRGKLYEAMRDPKYKKQEIFLLIDALKDDLTNPENLFHKDWESSREDLLEHLQVISKDLEPHRYIMRQITQIKQLLGRGPCYKELEGFIGSAWRFPIYRQEASEFKESLVFYEMHEVECMMKGMIKFECMMKEMSEYIRMTEARRRKHSIMGRIGVLMNFIQHDSFLNYNGKKELLKLRSIKRHFGVHMAIIEKEEELNSLLSAIVENRGREVVEKTKQEAHKCFEQWQGLIQEFSEHYEEDFSEHYEEELEKLGQKLEDRTRVF